LKIGYKFVRKYERYKVQFTLEQAMKALGKIKIEIYSFFNIGIRLAGWSTPRTSRFTPGKLHIDKTTDSNLYAQAPVLPSVK
jgi:hypothetical protein